MHKLLLNFTWWVNRKDVGGNNVFEGGFLGLDNVGPFDRSAALPVAGVLEQSDGTAWMAMYALNLLEIALLLADRDPVYEDLATKFFEHFAYIAEASFGQGLWDEDDSFFYDVLRTTDGHRVPLKVRSVVGLLPLAAATIIPGRMLRKLPDLSSRLRWFLTNRPVYTDIVGAKASRDGRQMRLLSMVGTDQLVRILGRMLSPEEFLSDHGLRTLSRAHPGRAVHRAPRRQRLHRRVRAGGVDERAVRRQLQLARPDLDAGQLHPHRGAAPLRAVLRRQPAGGVPGRGPRS
jgi:hypothetical protein